MANDKATIPTSQIKIFTAGSEVELAKMINAFITDKVTVINISYNVALCSIPRKAMYAMYTALVNYK